MSGVNIEHSSGMVIEARLSSQFAVCLAWHLHTMRLGVIINII